LGVAVPQRRRYCWALRCAIVVLRRFALRRTDGSVGTTPTGRRRYGGGCATHRRQITKKLNQTFTTRNGCATTLQSWARWSWFWAVSVSSLGCAPQGVAVPQRRYYWALRCAIVVPRRFGLRCTDGSVGATPTGRRRYAPLQGQVKNWENPGATATPGAPTSDQQICVATKIGFWLV